MPRVQIRPRRRYPVPQQFHGHRLLAVDRVPPDQRVEPGAVRLLQPPQQFPLHVHPGQPPRLGQGRVHHRLLARRPAPYASSARTVRGEPRCAPRTSIGSPA
ncbi:hypothetical protein GTX14_17440, partial [Streptomyces sp. SID4944]|nr:hypothetical protein [Streptomyces sp. SID4944]